MKTIQSINAYSGEVLGEYELFIDAQVVEKIELAHTAFQSWKKTSFEERKKLFYKLAELTQERLEEHAQLQTLEMGMLIGPSRKGLEGTARLIRWFADNAETYL